MNQEGFKLSWSTYSDHQRDMLQEIMKSDNLTDVTLVCDDDVQIKAHKVVLSASSVVFKKIIHGLPRNNTDSVIYLRGIQHQEMESILEFIYLGEATCPQKRMDELWNVAKNLEIKGLNKDVNIEKNAVIHEPDAMDMSYKDQSRLEVEPKQDQYLDKNNHQETQIMFKCEKCEKQFKAKKYLILHVYSVHSSIQTKQNHKFFSKPTNLSPQVKSENKGVFYFCDQCKV